MNPKHFFASLLLATSLLFSNSSAVAVEAVIDIPGLGVATVEFDYALVLLRYGGVPVDAFRARKLEYPFYVYATIRRHTNQLGSIVVEIKTISPDGTTSSTVHKTRMGPGADPSCNQCNNVFVWKGPIYKEDVAMIGDYAYLLIINGVEVGRLTLKEGSANS